jgi:DNA replication protein DnaC
MIPSGPTINRGDYLLLDDISRERVTEYNTGELQRIVRRRADNGYPTIVTTNHHPDDWEANHGEALADFFDRSFMHVEIGL